MLINYLTRKNKIRIYPLFVYKIILKLHGNFRIIHRYCLKCFVYFFKLDKIHSKICDLQRNLPTYKENQQISFDSGFFGIF